ncbi:MAG: dihydroneopterin aldolase [Pedosphaera sp.]|nr:dihydroneopterin aldolase [Pedosphaera sp.]
MSNITIVDLEVFYCVGVSDAERAEKQRLLLSLDMVFDISQAAANDRLNRTIDYLHVAEMLLKFGEGRSWKLIERVAADIGNKVLSTYGPQSVMVEVKKFPNPQLRYVSVIWTK